MRGINLISIIAISTLASGAAFAADMLPPPPVIGAPVGLSAEANGWYLRGDIGVGVSGKTSASSTFKNGPIADLKFNQSNLGDSAFAGVGLGYKINNWVRADVTGEYRGSAQYHAVSSYTATCSVNASTCYDKYSAKVSSGVFLANGYVDLGTWMGVTPFIGAGVGGAYNMVSGFTDTGVTTQGFGAAPDAQRWRFAWAGMAGASYAVSQNLQLELGYRYLDRGAATSGRVVCTNTQSCDSEVQKFKLASHDIRLGMRWMFADVVAAPALAAARVYTPAPAPAMAPAPGPITRKY
ncbi:MAG: porin family protein [Hyphomicrobiales bacterium]|nr:porin family protein [Hyphomicrobiales bacterium]